MTNQQPGHQQEEPSIEIVSKQEYRHLTDNETNIINKIHSKQPITLESSRVQDHALTSLYFLAMGIASLLPWSTILTTLDYYHSQFPDGQVSFYFPAAYSATILIVKLFMAWFKEIMSLNIRIAVSMTIQAILLCLLPLIATMVSHSSMGYWVVLATLLVLGTITQISHASSTGIAGYFPSKYMSNMTTGTGLSGVLCNLLRAITLVCFRNSQGKAYLYDMIMQYSVTAGFLVFCVVLHYKFIGSKYASDVLNEHLIDTNNEEYTSAEFPMLLKSKSRHIENIKGGLLKLWATFNHVKVLSIFMVLIYIQTLMLFPGVMLKQDIPIEDFAWKVVLMQFVYNISDTVGKYFTKNRNLLNKKFIYNLILFRFIFYFTFIAQAITKDAPILDDMWFTMLNIALFGVTNGFATSALFIFGPEEFEGQNKEIVGFLLLNCLSFGIMTGSFLALLFSNL